jgi:hypothetical protein
VPYKVTITFLVDAESEEILERYVDRFAYDIAARENFLLDNREILEVDVPVPGSYRTISAADLPYTGR